MILHIHLQIVGCLLVLLGLSHAFMNRYFGWRKKLAEYPCSLAKSSTGKRKNQKNAMLARIARFNGAELSNASGKASETTPPRTTPNAIENS